MTKRVKVTRAGNPVASTCKVWLSPSVDTVTRALAPGTQEAEDATILKVLLSTAKDEVGHTATAAVRAAKANAYFMVILPQEKNQPRPLATLDTPPCVLRPRHIGFRQALPVKLNCGVSRLNRFIASFRQRLEGGIEQMITAPSAASIC